MRKFGFLTALAALTLMAAGCKGNGSDAALFRQGEDTYCYIDASEHQVVFAAFDMLSSDVSKVFGSRLLLTADIRCMSALCRIMMSTGRG